MSMRIPRTSTLKNIPDEVPHTHTAKKKRQTSADFCPKMESTRADHGQQKLNEDGTRRNRPLSLDARRIFQVNLIDRKDQPKVSTIDDKPKKKLTDEHLKCKILPPDGKIKQLIPIDGPLVNDPTDNSNLLHTILQRQKHQHKNIVDMNTNILRYENEHRRYEQKHCRYEESTRKNAQRINRIK